MVEAYGVACPDPASCVTDGFPPVSVDFAVVWAVLFLLSLGVLLHRLLRG